MPDDRVTKLWCPNCCLVRPRFGDGGAVNKCSSYEQMNWEFAQRVKKARKCSYVGECATAENFIHITPKEAIGVSVTQRGWSRFPSFIAA